MVFAEIQELEDIGMPRLEVNRESSRALVATLIHVPCSVVEDAEHRNKAIGRSICARYVRACGTDAMDIKTDSASVLGNHGTRLQRVINPLDAVFFYINQEARS